VDTLTANDSMEWLNRRLSTSKIGSLSNLAKLTGINKGTLSKYFHGTQRPSIDVVEPLCVALNCSPETLLRALHAYSLKRNS